MERLLFTVTLKPGQEAEYERRHEAVWPALLDDLRAAGWRNYSIFRRELQVYGYVECHPDVSTAMAAMGDSDANARWGMWFEDVIDRLADEDGQMFTAREVWHMQEEPGGGTG